MKAHAKILQGHPLFARFASRTIRQLTAHSELINLSRGTHVYEAGDSPDYLYVVMTGRCQAVLLDANGVEQILDMYGPGDTFGERAVVTGQPYWCHVRVVTDCQLLQVSADDVNRLFEKTPRLAKQLVLRLVDQLPAFRHHMRSPKVGRVVTMTQLGPSVPGGVIGENLSTALQKEIREKVLFVELETNGKSVALEQWEDAGSKAMEEVTRTEESGLHHLHMSISGAPGEWERVPAFISELSASFRYVILLVPGDAPEATADAFVMQSDVCYPLFSQDEPGLKGVATLFDRIKNSPSGETVDLLPVVCLSYDEQAMSYEELSHRTGCTVAHTIHLLPDASPEDQRKHYAHSTRGRFSFHVRRIAREIGRCQVGLALSSGGAKGYSYVGVIQVLEENGIEVDVIAGTSMGAYVGSLWAYGQTGAELEERAREMTGRMALLKLLDPALPPRQGFIRGNKVERHLMKTIGHAHFSDMIRQLRVVATNLYTLERVVFDSGPVARAVHASTAMPGVMVPVRIDGRTVIDGGIADPLPIGVLMEMGIERIIAVNSIPTPDEMRRRHEERQGHSLAPEHRVLRQPAFGKLWNYFAPGNILDIMMRGIHGGQTRVAEGACKQADVVIRPVVPDGKWHDFTRPMRYVERGREVTEAVLPEIKALVERPR